MTIARYVFMTEPEVGAFKNKHGKWVTYADHCRAVEEAVKAERNRIADMIRAMKQYREPPMFRGIEEGEDAEGWKKLSDTQRQLLGGIAAAIRQEPT